MYIELGEMTRIKGRLSNINTELNGTLLQIKEELDNVCNNIKSTELVQSNNNLKTKINSLSENLVKEIINLEYFIESQISNYKITNTNAQEALISLINTLNNTFTKEGLVIRGGGRSQILESNSNSPVTLESKNGPATDEKKLATEVQPTETESTETSNTSLAAKYDVPLSDSVMNALSTACSTYGVDMNVMLGLIETESTFNTAAVNKGSQCYGLCQLSNKYYKSANMTPEENVTKATEIISENLKKYKGDIKAALTAYNAGHDTGSRSYANKVLGNADKYK